MNHSATPWIADNNGVITGGKYACTTIATTPQYLWEARLKDANFSIRGDMLHTHARDMVVESKANAEFIVHCCNSHEELVEALKKVESELIDVDMEVPKYLSCAITNAEKTP